MAKTGPSYVAIPRKWVMAWITVTIVLFVGILGAYQYTNYVAQQMCGLISISYDTYKTNPNPSPTGRKFILEFSKLIKKYHCN